MFITVELCLRNRCRLVVHAGTRIRISRTVPKIGLGEPSWLSHATESLRTSTRLKHVRCDAAILSVLTNLENLISLFFFIEKETRRLRLEQLGIVL